MRTGELPDDERGAVHEHLETCKSCSSSMTDISTLVTNIKALAVAPPRSCKDACSDSYEQLREDNEPVWVAFSSRGIRMILRGGTFDEFRAAYERRFCRTLAAATLPDALRTQVTQAIEGGGVDKPRVDWEDDESTELEREVLGALNTIPRGEVRTYEWVARQVGHPKAVRAVGTILAKNRVPFVVPCHRVVPSSGGIGNYAFGSAMKRELLRREGVDVDALDKLAKGGVRYVGSRTTKIACFPTCKDAKRIREENRVPFRGAGEAMEKGFRPCRRCKPFAA